MTTTVSQYLNDSKQKLHPRVLQLRRETPPAARLRWLEKERYTDRGFFRNARGEEKNIARGGQPTYRPKIPRILECRLVATPAPSTAYISQRPELVS